MCYTGSCLYEHKWTGECKLFNKFKPVDADCMLEEVENLLSEDDYELDEIIRLADIERVSKGGE